MTETILRAGFWPRFVATVIDYGVITAICAILGVTLAGLSSIRTGGETAWAVGVAGDPYMGALAGVIVGFELVGALYMSVEAWTGAPSASGCWG